VADAYLGEAVAAAVRLAPGRAADAVELMAWCASDLAKFKIPRYVRFVTEYPMTASGKIQKYKLREEHEAQLRTQD
jgi:acyl-CoA synthetase (AMP-forming)/AMP-acid ligase II